ncbi:MAG: HEAT repeat domain-containing protein [Algicola sp.]|nr:HEAT repeat domain-containing protein [Algicola sp.]
MLAAAALLLGQIGSSVTAWNQFTGWLKNHGIPVDNLGVMILLFIAVIVLLGVLTQLAKTLLRISSRQHKAPNQPLERETYLRWFGKDINKRLRSSIHCAQFIDLDTTTMPRAVLPWHFEFEEIKKGSETQSCNTINEILTAGENRLLLLGGPGSGKTTTLLDVAASFHEKAENHPDNKVPVLLNLSLWDSAESPGHSNNTNGIKHGTAQTLKVHNWIIESLAQIRGAGLCATTATSWIESANIWLLLDGLDEVKESLRSTIVQELNVFFCQHPGIPVIVCSRSGDYQALVETRSIRLELDMAIKVQPLTPDMIDNYLQAAKANQLRETLKTDPELRAMAATPLELSVMVLAYGDDAFSPEQPNGLLSMTARRLHLFETFVDSMMQRKARRDSGARDEINLQTNRRVKTPYSITQMNTYLGWLAQRMSERSRSSIHLGKLFQFLWEQNKENPRTLLTATRATIVGLFSFLVAFTFYLPQVTGFEILSSIGVSLLAGLFFLWLFVFADKVDNEKSEPLFWLPLWFALLPVFALVIGGANEFLPWPFAGYIELVLFAVFSFLLIGDFDTKEYWYKWFAVLLMIAVASLIIGTTMYSSLPIAGWSFAIASGAIIFCLGLTDIEPISSVTRWACYFISIALAGVWFFDGQNVLRSALVAAWIIGAIEFFWEDKPAQTFSAIAVFTVSVIIGGLLNVGFGIITGLISLFLIIYFRANFKLLSSPILANPILHFYLACNNRLPFRLKHFTTYGLDCMVLKGEMENLEFVHRRIRDYFAIRNIVSKLAANNDNRNAAAAQLVSLGDASCDVLLELINDNDPAIRRTCIAGLGKIGSAMAAQTLLNIIRTTGSGLRESAYNALHDVKDVAAIPLILRTLEQAQTDNDLPLCKSLFTALRNMDKLEVIDDIDGLRKQLGDTSLSYHLAKAFIRQRKLEHPSLISCFGTNCVDRQYILSAFSNIPPVDAIQQLLKWQLDYKDMLYACSVMSKEGVVRELVKLVSKPTSTATTAISLLIDLNALNQLPADLKSSLTNTLKQNNNLAKLNRFGKKSWQTIIKTIKEQWAIIKTQTFLIKITIQFYVKLVTVNPSRQISAINMAVKHDVLPLTGVLVKLLRAKHNAVRIAAAKGLTNLKTVPPEGLELIADSDEQVHKAGLALFKTDPVALYNNGYAKPAISTTRFEAPIQASSSDLYAFGALGGHSWNLALLLSQLPPQSRAKAKEYFYRFPVKTYYHHLANFLLNGIANYHEEIAAALIYYEPSDKELSRLLNNVDINVRKKAIDYLLHTPSTDAAPALIKLLNSKNKQEVKEVISILGEMQEKSVIPRFFEFAREDFFAKTAIEALLQLGEKNSVTIFVLHQIEKQHPKFLAFAEELLPRLDPLITIEGLLAHSHADCPNLRTIAAKLLGVTEQGQASVRLIELLEDFTQTNDGKRVCDAAAHALDMIGTQAIMQTLDTWRAQQQSTNA